MFLVLSSTLILREILQSMFLDLYLYYSDLYFLHMVSIFVITFHEKKIIQKKKTFSSWKMDGLDLKLL